MTFFLVRNTLFLNQIRISQSPVLTFISVRASHPQSSCSHPRRVWRMSIFVVPLRCAFMASVPRSIFSLCILIIEERKERRGERGSNAAQRNQTTRVRCVYCELWILTSNEIFGHSDKADDRNLYRAPQRRAKCVLIHFARVGLSRLWIIVLWRMVILASGSYLVLGTLFALVENKARVTEVTSVFQQDSRSILPALERLFDFLSIVWHVSDQVTVPSFILSNMGPLRKIEERPDSFFDRCSVITIVIATMQIKEDSDLPPKEKLLVNRSEKDTSACWGRFSHHHAAVGGRWLIFLLVSPGAKLGLRSILSNHFGRSECKLHVSSSRLLSDALLCCYFIILSDQ